MYEVRPPTLIFNNPKRLLTQLPSLFVALSDSKDALVFSLLSSTPRSVITPLAILSETPGVSPNTLSTDLVILPTSSVAYAGKGPIDPIDFPISCCKTIDIAFG